MAYTARKTKFKNVVHMMLLTAVMTAGGHALFTTSKSVWAEDGDAGEITKERLDAFYERSVAAQMTGEKEILAFADKHLHKDFESVMHVTSKIEGAPTQKETTVLTKFEYLRDIKKAYKISTVEELKSGIVSYDIAKDGRSAKIKDRTYTMVSIPLGASQGKSEVYNLRQFINCDSFYTLSETDVLLLKSSTCEIEGQMSKAQNL